MIGLLRGSFVVQSWVVPLAGRAEDDEARRFPTFILKQGDGVPVAEICCKAGLSQATAVQKFVR